MVNDAVGARRNSLTRCNAKCFQRQAPFQLVLFPTLLSLFFAGCSEDNKTSDGTNSRTIHVSGILLNKSTLELEVGDEERLYATVVPDNADNKGIRWESDDKHVATVDADGLVRAVSRGQTVIHAISAGGEKSISLTVTVVTPVEGVSLGRCPGTVLLGSQEQLEATVEPRDASNQAVVWTSSDPTRATVDENGLVSTLEQGEVTIVARSLEDGEKTKSCRMKIVVLVSGVSIDKCPREVLTSSSWWGSQLEAIVEPDNATNKNVTWHSSNERVATVNQKGYVSRTTTNATGGTTTIKVTTEDGEWTDTCDVNVRIPLTGVTANCGTATLTPGQTRQLTFRFIPSNATVNPREVRWESLDPHIATVDRATGLLTVPANSAGGTATMRVKTAEGGFQATCSVTVYIPLARVIIEGCPTAPSYVLDAGSILPLSVKFEPSRATNKHVEWTTSHSNEPERLMSAHTTYNVESRRPGPMTVRVRAADNQSATCTVNVRHVISDVSTHSVLCAQRFYIRGKGLAGATAARLSSGEALRIEEIGHTWWPNDEDWIRVVRSLGPAANSKGPLSVVVNGITAYSPFDVTGHWCDN